VQIFGLFEKLDKFKVSSFWLATHQYQIPLYQAVLNLARSPISRNLSRDGAVLGSDGHQIETHTKACRTSMKPCKKHYKRRAANDNKRNRPQMPKHYE
jgi:hypothetical protein